MRLDNLRSHPPDGIGGGLAGIVGQFRAARVSAVDVDRTSYGLAADIENVEKEIKRFNDEIRRLGAGLMNDEKRKRIKSLKATKQKRAKKLRKLKAELAGQGNRRP